MCRTTFLSGLEPWASGMICTPANWPRASPTNTTHANAATNAAAPIHHQPRRREFSFTAASRPSCMLSCSTATGSPDAAESFLLIMSFSLLVGMSCTYEPKNKRKLPCKSLKKCWIFPGVFLERQAESIYCSPTFGISSRKPVGPGRIWSNLGSTLRQATIGKRC